MQKNSLNPPIILASASPRRKEILAKAGYTFDVKIKEVDEIYPHNLPTEQVPLYLAELKSEAFMVESQHFIVITADTVVNINNKILGKPKTEKEAYEMLKLLSNQKHEVISGVCLLYNGKKISFTDKTHVYFKNLSDQEIEYYIQNFRPLDKAGAYGIQEWIGMIGITKIEGSFYNVMGLPIQLLHFYLNQIT
jgi:septum formation protein